MTGDRGRVPARTVGRGPDDREQTRSGGRFREPSPSRLRTSVGRNVTRGGGGGSPDLPQQRGNVASPCTRFAHITTKHRHVHLGLGPCTKRHHRMFTDKGAQPPDNMTVCVSQLEMWRSPPVTEDSSRSLQDSRPGQLT